MSPLTGHSQEGKIIGTGKKKISSCQRLRNKTGGYKEEGPRIWGMAELFWILITVMVVQLSALIKTHTTLHQKSICKL